MTPCRFFSQGRCTYGASCKNSHEAVPGPDTWRPLPSRSEAQSTATFPGTTSMPTTPSASVRGPCWFFSQGKCTYGAACRMSHEPTSPSTNSSPVRSKESKTLASTFLTKEIASSSLPLFVPGALQHASRGSGLPPPKLKADAPSFTPITATSPQRRGISIATEMPVCIFYSKGFCRNGETCSFWHEPPTSLSSQNPSEHQQNISGLSNHMAELSIGTSVVQEFNGASVTFEAGGEISSVKLSSDFSAIQISGLPPDVQASFVTGILAGLGFELPESSISIKTLGAEESVAEVKVEDPSFAKTVSRKFEYQQDDNAKSKISIRAMAGNGAPGALANRLQLSTVTCTWYKPSRVAWLVFRSYADAKNAKRVLESRKILQRSPTCSFQRGGISLPTTLHVGDLDRATRERDLEALFAGLMRPLRITLGNPSYELSDNQASEIIETLLRGQGRLESFQWQVLPGNYKIKATATFTDRDEAAEAVQSLNNTTLPSLGNTKLFVGHVVSVKYNIPSAIVEAIRSDMDRLRENIWQTGHIHLKSYPQVDPAKPVIAVRIFGESIKHVAEGKAALEKMLAGYVVTNEGTTLWDPYFLDRKSLEYLNELSRDHKLYIHRDARSCRLLIYGGSATARAEVERLLLTKLTALKELTHTIILTPDLLKRAMQGGMRRLKEKFEAAVTLNISANPKTISITGSAADAQEAQAMLMENSSSTGEEDDCVVCWTEATECLHTSCGHVYCKDCFANQVSSVSDRDIPVRCCKCLKVFSISELRTMLGESAFVELLGASFDIYIRTHPKAFQHCPTPDCPQVYRITSTRGNFFCSTCLTSICTTCNVVAHDGMTCEEYKDLTSEGNVSRGVMRLVA